MHRRSVFTWSSVCLLALGCARIAWSAPILLFNETFNGYTQFPVAIPAGDPINGGIAEVSEGALSFWYGGRFQAGDGTIDSDLAIQKWGSSRNETPAGRFEDGAGLVFRVNTTGFDQIVLDFDWRTFNVQSDDRFVAGYHVGDDLGFDTTTNRFRTLNWSNWTQLISNPPFDSFRHETFALPSNVGPVYVAFWMKGSENNYGKIDNIAVNAGATIVIPEPFSGMMCVLALAFATKRRRRSRSPS